MRCDGARSSLTRIYAYIYRPIFWNGKPNSCKRNWASEGSTGTGAGNRYKSLVESCCRTRCYSRSKEPVESAVVGAGITVLGRLQNLLSQQLLLPF